MNNYLTFSSAEPFTIGVYNATKNWDGTLYYSTDTETWSEWDGTASISSALHEGQHRIYMRGSGNSVITGRRTLTSKYWWVLTGSEISCNGNIETLLDYETVASGAHPIMGADCYCDMFYKCTALISAPELPATTLTNACYSGLFYECSNLISAPELPATNLAAYCYFGMFRGCKALTSAPELPATTLALGCYESMFRDCENLISAPELPATDLAKYCYSNMFSECTTLINAPKLPATNLADSCYSHMFYYSTALTDAPKLPATNLEADCYNHMFYHCDALTSIPELPATMLVEGCYYEMFRYCANIKLSETQTDEYPNEYRIPASGTGEIATDIEEWEVFSNMFGRTGGTFTSNPEINTTYYTANEVVRCEDEPETPEQPEQPEPTTAPADLYKIKNGAWQKQDTYKPVGDQWVKQPQGAIECEDGAWSALS